MFHVCSSNPFREKGFWFKGNLHTHTTNSDGALSPEQTIRLYKKNGYDFLSITDHEVVTGIKQLSEVFKDGFLLIPGAELAVGRSETQTRYHIVALNLEHMIETGDDPQTAIDNVKNEGGEALVAHPSWSALTTHDILKLKGYLGIEIFNSTCHFAVSKGYSTIPRKSSSPRPSFPCTTRKRHLSTSHRLQETNINRFPQVRNWGKFLSKNQTD